MKQAPTLSSLTLNRHLRILKNPLSKLALCAVLLLGGCKDHYETGLDAITEQRWDDARNEARLGKAQDPADPRYDLLMAEAMVKEAMALSRDDARPEGSPRVEHRKAKALYTKALPHAKRAYDSKQLDARAGRILGKIYWELEQRADTVDAWQRARAADPNAVSDEDYLGALRFALNESMTFDNFEPALSIRTRLKELVTSKPALIEAQPPEVARELRKEISDEAFRTNREKLARGLTEQRKYDEAIALYDELAKKYPDESKYHYQRGRLLLQTGKEKEASEAFDAYVKTPDRRERMERLKDVAKRAELLGVRSIALTSYEKLLSELEDKPSLERAPILFKLADINLQIDDLKSARGYIRRYIEELKALEGDPLKADVYLTVASKAKHHNHEALAIELLEEALADAPANLRVMEKLAAEYAKKAHYGDAERVLKKYVEKSGTTRKSLEQAALWAQRKRNYDLAQFFYEKITERSDVMADDWYELARIYAAQARLDELRRAIDAYLKMRGEDRRAIRNAAEIFGEQRLYEEAEKLLLKAQKKHPEDLSIADRLARLYEEWGKTASVHDAYEVYIKARGRKAADLQSIGSRFFRNNAYDEALPYLIEAAEKGEHDAWRQVAECYVKQRRDKDVKLALDKYLAKAPNRAQSLKDVIQVYNKANMDDALIKIYEELIALEPQQQHHYQNLSELYLEQGREREAFELWSRYLERARDPYKELSKMAQFFERRGHQDWILSFYQQLLEKGSVDAQIYAIVGDTFYNVYKTLEMRNQEQSAEKEEALNKAELYYTRYFEEVKPRGKALEQFASKMKNKRMFKLSASAYRRFIEIESNPRNHIWLNLGEVLLEIGEVEDAEVAFARYYKESRENDSASENIAGRLMNKRLYGLAEVYLERLISSNNRNTRQVAFERLAEIYRQSDRTDEMRKLAQRYLSRSSNPTQARSHIENAAINSGMWELAIEQLEQRARSSNNDLHYEIGKLQWRANLSAEAQATWRDWASRHEHPDKAWAAVAHFYEKHARPDLAIQAYDQAIKSDATAWAPFVARGKFLLKRGETARAMEDFEQAIEKSPPNENGNIYEAQIYALKEVGQHNLVRKIAREGLKDRTGLVEVFIEPLASHAFVSGDSVIVDRMVSELKASGVTVDRVVGLLVEHRLYEEAATIIEEEIAVGDFIMASSVLIDNMDVFTRLGGIDRLMRAMQPLLEKDRGNAILEGILGQYLIKEGHLERGAIFLRVALDRNEVRWRSLLAHTNLQLGNHDEAYRLFIEELEATPEKERGRRLKQIVLRYVVSGEARKMRQMLEHLMRDERFIKDAVPLLVSVMIQRGEILPATAMIRDFVHVRAKSDSMKPMLLDDSISASQYREVFLNGVTALAIHGYGAEARALLADVPAEVTKMDAYQQLELRLEQSGDADRIDALIAPMLDTSEEVDHKTRIENLKVAHTLIVAGDHARARTIAEAHLDATNPIVSEAAISLLMRSAFITEELDRQRAWVARYLELQPDKQRTREGVAKIYHQLGQDREAMALLRENVERMPTAANIQSAMSGAQKLDDVEAYTRYAAMAWRTLDDPMLKMSSETQYLLARHDMYFLTPLLRPVRETYPADINMMFAEVMVKLRLGETSEAREILLTHLEARDFEPSAVETVLLELAHHQHWVEAARAIGKKVPEEKLSNNSLLYLGISEAGLGFDAEAKAYLDRFIQSHHDTGEAAHMVSMFMLAHEKPALALAYAEVAVRKHPTRPNNYLARGLARMSVGDIENAKPDFERCLESGVGRLSALLSIGISAAKQGDYEYAERVLLELARTPSPNSPGEGLNAAISAWLEAGKPQQGLRFIEKHYPDLLARGVAEDVFFTRMASLYEDAGFHEQGFHLYKQLARRIYLENPASSEVATYANNLAYSFSTTNKNIEEGEALVRRAIALSHDRSESFIDTLGWIYYRQGKLADAEREVKRALQSSRENPRNLTELYDHLATLREEQGYHEDAIWLRLYLETLD